MKELLKSIKSSRCLKSLENAISIYDKYNSMGIDVFYKLVENEYGCKFTEHEISEWKFSGLNNVDFFKMFLSGNGINFEKGIGGWFDDDDVFSL